VSVVVPTHNRARLLARTLESLLDQRAGSIRYEILVVDNNSTDHTRAVVEGFSRRTPWIRYLFEPRPGVSHARNTGTSAARAPILAFIDDDVEADPTWVASIVRTLDEHPEVDCVGGRIQARWRQPPPRWLTPFHWGALALQDAKGPYVDAENASPCLMTANFVCRRSALEEVGGFSPAFLRDEDRELQLRLWQAGKRGLYAGDLVVTTEVPDERLKKAYHRQFHLRVGASHARMRYLDRLDRDGRLAPQPPARLTLLGTPCFVYRKLAGHVWRWAWSALRLDWNRAFFHETRVRYFVGYIRTRYREEQGRPLAFPAEVQRVVRSRARSWLRRGAGESVSV
jgi:glycosyltransferase involved in cell wall biosynthesis